MSTEPTTLPRTVGSWIQEAGRQAALIARMRKHGKGFLLRIVGQALAILALVEAIFLAERFTIVFRDAANKDANLFDIFLILGCTSTEIFDLALAIAVLMAVYAVALQMRENRELLVLFAAGSGPFHLAALALIVALGSLLVSLSVSGFIDPASRYVQRLLLQDAEIRALKTGISKGQFYFFPDYVAFAPEQNAEDQLFAPNESYLAAGHAFVPHKRAQKNQNRRLFLYQQAGPETSRILTADRARLDGPDSFGRIVLHLSGFSQHMFNDREIPTPLPSSKACPGCPSVPSDIPQITMNLHDLTEVMRIDQLLPFPPRGSEQREQTIWEEVTSSTANTAYHRADMELLGERLTRSLLCLLAPFIALLAVGLTTRLTSYFALPIACMSLMALNLTGEWLVRTIAPLNPWQALAFPLCLTIASGGLLSVLIVLNQGALVRPGLARS